MKKLILVATLCGCMMVQGVAQGVDKIVSPNQEFEIPSATPAPDGAVYRWLLNGAIIADVNTITYHGALSTAGTYIFIRQAMLSGSCTDWLSSNPYVVAVVCEATLSSGTADRTICSGLPMDPIRFTTSGVTSGSQISVSNTLPVGITASWSSNTLTISGTPAVSGVFPYTVTLCGAMIASGIITVHAVPVVYTASPSAVCYNTQATLSCTVSSSTTTAMTYTWKIGNATHVTTAPAVTTASLTSATTYNVYVADANGCTSTVSNTVNIPVTGSFTQGNLSAATICNGAFAMFNLAPATGGLGDVTYLWEQSSDSSTWVNAAAQSGDASYISPALVTTTYYRRSAINTMCATTLTTSGAAVTVISASKLDEVNRCGCEDHLVNCDGFCRYTCENVTIKTTTACGSGTKTYYRTPAIYKSYSRFCCPHGWTIGGSAAFQTCVCTKEIEKYFLHENSHYGSAMYCQNKEFSAVSGDGTFSYLCVKD